MEKQDFDNYLNDRYEDQVAWYSARASTFKRWYYFLQTSLIFFSALTPALIAMGVTEIKDSVWRYTPLVTSFLVAVLVGLLKTFKYQETWLEYRTTAETLKKEKYLYQAGTDEYADAEDKEALFVARVEALISRQNTLWVQRYSTDHEEG